MSLSVDFFYERGCLWRLCLIFQMKVPKFKTNGSNQTLFYYFNNWVSLQILLFLCLFCSHIAIFIAHLISTFIMILRCDCTKILFRISNGYCPFRFRISFILGPNNFLNETLQVITLIVSLIHIQISSNVFNIVIHQLK